MNELRYSPEALADLDEIWEYILSELSNPDAAANTVDGILDAVDGFGNSRKAARPCPR